jgi:hypothetical protein
MIGRAFAMGLGLAIASCTALGLAPANLIVDCDAQDSVLLGNLTVMPKLLTAERASIDALREQSHGYCHGTLPVDQTAGSKAVEAATAEISATIAIAAVRN